MKLPHIFGWGRAILGRGASKTNGTTQPSIRVMLANLKRLNRDAFISQEELNKAFSSEVARRDRNFADKLLVLFKDPNFMAFQFDLRGKITADSLLLNICHPSRSSIRLAPELFARTSKEWCDAQAWRQAIKKDIKRLREIPGKDGEPFFSFTEIKRLLSTKEVNGSPSLPIHNAVKKIKAVLNNPEEVARISKFGDKVNGVYNSIDHPLHSTIDANPKLWRPGH